MPCEFAQGGNKYHLAEKNLPHFIDSYGVAAFGSWRHSLFKIVKFQKATLHSAYVKMLKQCKAVNKY